MPIRVVCPGCSASIKAPESAIGKQAACPKCETRFTIAAPEAVAAAASSTSAKGPARQASQPSKAASQASVAKPTAAAPKAAKAKPTGPQAAEAKLTVERLVSAFEGPIDPVRTTLLYRVGILLSLLTMLVLPLVYLALIAGACYGVYYHAVNHTGIFEGARGRASVYAFLLYLAPLLAGPIMILFMVKPLFARPAKHQKTRSLNRQHEPVLFAFVDKICETVRSPKPKRIDIDCQVNASASFRKGMLSMLGNDLVLTIGMPLVAGLSARQLGGVLAHEFGHFTQGAGMRLTYLVRSISHWFVRVVYERDEWDEWLASAAGSIDIRVGWVLWLAMLSVWITRKVLWVLLHVGMGVAGFTLRQMEFDADRYEARFAGSETFASTARRLHELNAGMQMAYNQLGSSHQEGRLVDDIPTLARLNASKLPTQAKQFVTQAIETGKTGLFDTHPCDRDRIASARAEEAAGVLRLDAPAAALLSDFSAQSKATTWEFYREVFGDGVKKSALEPVEAAAASHAQQEEADQRLSGYFQQAVRAYRPLPLGSGFLAAPENPRATLEKLKAARQAVADGAAEARELLKKHDKADEKLTEATAYEAYHNAGLKMDKSVAKSLQTREGARNVQTKAKRAMNQVGGQLGGFEKNVADRLRCGLELLQVDKVAARLDDPGKLRASAKRILPALVAIEGQMDTINVLTSRNIMLAALVHQAQSAGQADEQLVGAIDRVVDVVQPKMTQVRDVLTTTPYPFPHKDKSVSVGGFALSNPPSSKDLGAVISALGEMTDRIITMRRRALGELGAIAEQVESALGMPPLAAPPATDAEVTEEA